MAESGFVKIAEMGDLSPGEMMAVDVGDQRILLANVDGNVCAIDDTCTHAYASLSDGDLSGNEVECPLHGATFNVHTGEVLTPPAPDSVKAYELRIEGQDILLGPSKA
jgi:3-phenylpropionate/trans-cinnamate dioxygenase ferredoxin subunit